ncbi:hypothetical protein JCM19241_3139 [Vibrio ishigakensis]|uniref:Uncharacterized protein n=1 Tax=Vibrio ishigakensis TaxID=1481914 RepID=A0A0B8QGC6_9VIBR|nr:hypothetical protein JCM19241_3139 [Vibrio ishigakensis]
MHTSTWALIADIYTPLLLAIAVYLLLEQLNRSSVASGFALNRLSIPPSIST